MARPPDIVPMLASSGVPANLDGWTAEPKLDGWRVRVAAADGRVWVRSRSGRVINSVPGLDGLAGSGRAVLLDGELVAGAGTLADFDGLAGAVASRRRTVPLTFVAFDLLWLDGTLLTELPQRERRLQLDVVELGVTVVPSFSFDEAPLLLRACELFGAEGIVLKNGTGRYLPGRRSAAWRKVKTDAWRSSGRPERIAASRRR